MATNEKSSAVLTDAEIKKALECCPQDNPNHNCARCTYKPIEGYCFDYLMKDALDLINRLEADKEAIIAGQETLQKALAEKNAEIEKLKNDCFGLSIQCIAMKDCIVTVAEEAVQEFAERFENELTKIEEIYFEEEHENFISANKVIALLVNLVQETESENNETNI